MKTFKFNTSICTNIEQSKRLLYLGVDPRTADMHWEKLGDLYGNALCFRYKEFNTAPDCHIPAWSLHRLIEMLPEIVGCSSLVLYKDSLSYINKDLFVNFFSTAYFGDHNNLYDNIIDCIEWLIEEKCFDTIYLVRKEKNENI